MGSDCLDYLGGNLNNHKSSKLGKFEIYFLMRKEPHM